MYPGRITVGRDGCCVTGEFELPFEFIGQYIAVRIKPALEFETAGILRSSERNHPARGYTICVVRNVAVCSSNPNTRIRITQDRQQSQIGDGEVTPGIVSDIRMGQTTDTNPVVSPLGQGAITPYERATVVGQFLRTRYRKPVPAAVVGIFQLHLLRRIEIRTDGIPPNGDIIPDIDDFASPRLVYLNLASGFQT